MAAAKSGSRERGKGGSAEQLARTRCPPRRPDAQAPKSVPFGGVKLPAPAPRFHYRARGRQKRFPHPPPE